MKLNEILDFDKCKALVKQTPEDEYTILCPHYSINVQSKIEGEKLQYDLDELEQVLDCSVFVSQYDDLCANPHNLDID